MKQYVSRRYLKEKWEKLRVDMECVIGVYDDGPDNVAEEAARVAYEIKDFMESISKEVGIEPKHGRWIHEHLASTSGGSYAVVRCSNCLSQYPMTEENYCPNCGAIMDL